MIQETCCFTGHRYIPSHDIYKITNLTEGYIRNLINMGIKYFGVGGALGYDTLAAKILFRLRDTEFNYIKGTSKKAAFRLAKQSGSGKP